jgi:hypothetical protein
VVWPAVLIQLWAEEPGLELELALVPGSVPALELVLAPELVSALELVLAPALWYHHRRPAATVLPATP